MRKLSKKERAELFTLRLDLGDMYDATAEANPDGRTIVELTEERPEKGWTGQEVANHAYVFHKTDELAGFDPFPTDRELIEHGISDHYQRGIRRLAATGNGWPKGIHLYRGVSGRGHAAIGTDEYTDWAEGHLFSHCANEVRRELEAIYVSTEDEARVRADAERLISHIRHSVDLILLTAEEEAA